jgi:hypothetical protein
MTTSLWLRVSSVVSLLFAAGHTLGGRKSWSPVGETAVLQAMRTVRFDVFGVSRTYLDFYIGFGYSLSVFLFLQAVLLWQLARIATPDPSRVKGMIAAFAVATVIGGVLAWTFIFPLPAVFSAVLAVCLGIAFFTPR